MTTFPMKRGEFNLLRKIGEGGMAEVFLAERGGDEGFKTLVALKRLHSGFALDQYFIRQLVQEAKLLGQLQQNNIVRVHDLRRIEDEYFIVMEYIDGIDLAQAIQVHRDNDLRFPLSIFFHVALSLCEALEFAHTAVDLDGKPIRLIHRDIKPSNVLISHRGIVKLTDFGIARVGDTSNTGSVVKGTANYMSPEQASGEQSLTPASDIFSLGAVFWEMLTLEKLVDGSNYLNVINSIKELNVGLKDITKKGIEPGLRMILLRMLARKRELRYQSMGLVLKDLRFVAEQMKVDLSPSHLREYMAKITNLAREAAARMVMGQNLASGFTEAATGEAATNELSAGSGGPAGRPIPDKTGPTQAQMISPPEATGPTKGSPPEKAGDEAFAESVAALKALVQTGNIPPAAVPDMSTPAPNAGASENEKAAIAAAGAAAVAAGIAAAGAASTAAQAMPPSAASMGKQQPSGGTRPPIVDADVPTPPHGYTGLGASSEAPTAPPMQPVPLRPGQVPPSRRAADAPPVIDPDAASPPSAVALRSQPAVGKAAGVPAPPADTLPPIPPAKPIVKRNDGAAASSSKKRSRKGVRVTAPPPVAAPPPAAGALTTGLGASQATPAGAAVAQQTGYGAAQQTGYGAAQQTGYGAAQSTGHGQVPGAAAQGGAADWSQDGEDEDDYYADTRRANMIVLAVGAIAALVVVGLIIWLMMTPGDGGEELADGSGVEFTDGDGSGDGVRGAVAAGAGGSTDGIVDAAGADSVAASAEDEAAAAEAAEDARAAREAAELAAAEAAAERDRLAQEDARRRAASTSRSSTWDSSSRGASSGGSSRSGSGRTASSDSGSSRSTSGSSRSTSGSSRTGSGSSRTGSGSGSASTGSSSRSGSSGSSGSGSAQADYGSPSTSGSSSSSGRSSGSSSSGSSSSGSSGSGSSSSGSSGSGASGSGSSGSSSGSDDWATSSGSRSSDLRSPYDDDAGSGSSPGDTVAALEAPAGAPLGTELLASMSDKARRGRLTSEEMDQLQGVGTSSDEFNQARVVLLAQHEAAGNPDSHCRVATEMLAVSSNAADPQVNLEMSKCHLRNGKFSAALETARVAELNAQDIPSRVRTDRQLKIWEVQAKAYKGMYQSTENLDFIDDSIAIWKRYQHMAGNTYRQREAEKADKEIRSLSELKGGAL